MSKRNELEVQLKKFSGKAKEVMHKLLLISLEQKKRQKTRARSTAPKTAASSRLTIYGNRKTRTYRF